MNDDLAWHSLDGSQVLERLGAVRDGLTSAEAGRRRARHGANELRRGETIRPLLILAAQFQSLIVWILVLAALVSGVFQEWVDCIVILSIVVLNAGIGFFQEYHSEQALQALRRMTAPRARVRRDSKSGMVPAADVVPGDILEIEAGDLVPADARVLEASELRTNEAALTGESEPVDKRAPTLPDPQTPLADRQNMLHMGTSVAAGNGVAVAVGTGADTEIGRIAQLLETTGDDATPLQKRLTAFGRVLVWACLGIVALVFLLGLVRGEPLFQLFLTSVSLAVAAVPEGLPAVVTIALAVGVQRMARRRTLVRRLHAVETLGSTNVICSDKTGTLTVGEMTVRELVTSRSSYQVGGEGYEPFGRIELTGGPDDADALRELLTTLVGCNSARLSKEGTTWTVIGDPTEGALLAAGQKAGITADAVDQESPEVRRFPFDSDRKRMTVVRQRAAGRLRALVKGAPDLVLARSTHVRVGSRVEPLDADHRKAIQASNAVMAERGRRVLAAAVRECAGATAPDAADSVEQDLVFLGLVGMQDPPRPAAKQAVADCRSAGIRVIMITGDQPATALAIARELGIAGPDDLALTGTELDRLAEAGLEARVPRVAVYARVTAAHKLRIVRAWQANGGVVAMTGDGVNDAPAIKGADIGIAMGRSGTEVTKEASDMVITDDHFDTIVAAVEEGRGAYANIKKTLQYLLAGNAGELLLMTACVGMGLPTPLLPVHLLWINLVTDGLPALCLATDPIDHDVMRQPPRPRGQRVTDRSFLFLMLATGLLTAGVAAAAYLVALRTSTAEVARAHAFSALVFAELLRSFGCRSETRLVTEMGLRTNLKLLLVVVASFGIQLLAPHVPLLASVLKLPAMPMSHCLWLALAGSVPLIVLEALKVIRRRRRAR